MIGRRNDAGVGLEGFRPPHTLKFLLLQHSQELGLKNRAHIGDLIQKERAAGCQLKAPGLALRRAGECPALVAEELGLQEGLRNGSAVDGDERPLGLRPLIMDDPRDELLAGAALPREQDRSRGVQDQFHQAVDVLHFRAFTDQRFELHRLRHGLAQVAIFLRQPLPRRLQLLNQARVLKRQRQLIGERLQQPHILCREDPLALVDGFQDAEDAILGAQRGADDRTRFRAGVHIDITIEAWVTVGIQYDL